MSLLKFRNLSASVDDPVETWPFEGILTAIERGTLPDWRRMATAIRADPWGPVAQQVLEALEVSRPYGTAALFTTIIERARQDAADGADRRHGVSAADAACPRGSNPPGGEPRSPQRG